MLKTLLDGIRSQGWSVAVHNDYRQGGKVLTFWLFTRGDECVKGEGEGDEAALAEVREKLDARARADARSANRDAIAAGGFRVAPDLLGKPTLWCVECGRDSGFHRPDCSKSEASK